MKNQPRWVTWGEKELAKGVKRIPGPLSDERILQYFCQTSWNPKSDEPSYCSAAICCMAVECKLPNPASAAAMDWVDAQGYRKISTYRHGALVVSKRNDPNNPRAAHITIAYGDDSPLFYWGLGGNQKDGAWSVSKFPKSNVIAILWPNGEPL